MLAVSTGAPWWGFPTQQGRVLYINFELPDFAFQHRLTAIAGKKGITDFTGIDLWNLRGFATDFSVLIPKILSRVKDERYALIVLDPIYKGLGKRDENKAGDIASLCNEIEQLAVQSGAAVVFGAHYSKGNQAGKEAIDRIGGSGVFARDPDVILTMTPHEEKNAYVDRPHAARAAAARRVRRALGRVRFRARPERRRHAHQDGGPSAERQATSATNSQAITSRAVPPRNTASCSTTCRRSRMTAKPMTSPVVAYVAEGHRRGRRQAVRARGSQACFQLPVRDAKTCGTAPF